MYRWSFFPSCVPYPHNIHTLWIFRRKKIAFDDANGDDVYEIRKAAKECRRTTAKNHHRRQIFNDISHNLRKWWSMSLSHNDNPSTATLKDELHDITSPHSRMLEWQLTRRKLSKTSLCRNEESLQKIEHVSWTCIVFLDLLKIFRIEYGKKKNILSFEISSYYVFMYSRITLIIPH